MDEDCGSWVEFGLEVVVLDFFAGVGEDEGGLEAGGAGFQVFAGELLGDYGVGAEEVGAGAGEFASYFGEAGPAREEADGWVCEKGLGSGAVAASEASRVRESNRIERSSPQFSILT